MRIGDLLLIGLFILLMIILSPIIVPVIIYLYIREKIVDRLFSSYLIHNEGARFFCYTARRTSEAYVEENVLPFLPLDTKIIYLGDSKKIYSLGDDVPFLDRLVLGMKLTPGGYPYAAKISEGSLVTISINAQLYSAIRRNADADAINKKIGRFLADTNE